MKNLITTLVILIPIYGVAQSNNTGTFKVRKKANPNTEVEYLYEDFSIEKPLIIVEDMPEFPGGQKAMNQFLSANIVYPLVAKENNISGTVYVTFIVGIDGTLKDIKVIRGVDKLLNEEAFRVVKLMPKWTPGKQRGRSVEVLYNMPINFRLK